LKPRTRSVWFMLMMVLLLLLLPYDELQHNSTPLHCSAHKDAARSVRRLVLAGARIEARNNVCFVPVFLFGDRCICLCRYLCLSNASCSHGAVRAHAAAPRRIVGIDQCPDCAA
jgi:hypothetical protein